MIFALIGTALAFTLTVLVCPLVIRLVKKWKAQQTILHYVESHKAKSGTPTMGGLAFIFGIGAAALTLFRGEKRLGLVSVAVMAGYGLIGFLDDFIKVRLKRNLGLRAWQKIISQVLIAVIIAVFVYMNPYLGSSVYAPFSAKLLDLKWFIIPYIVLIFLACTNSVNLTDGLDGLAGGVTAVYAAAFGAIVFIVAEYLRREGAASGIVEEYNNLLILCGCLLGGTIGFLCYNTYPARIFMGDAGSLALGGVVGCLAIFTGLSLLVPILGVMYAASSLSVIIQVLHFKRTKGKRVFLMAPLHHHFEKKGVFEGKIVAFYMIITLLVGIVCVGAYLYVFS